MRVKAVRDGDELMMITKGGQVVRIGVTGERREMGRNTAGVPEFRGRTRKAVILPRSMLLAPGEGNV